MATRFQFKSIGLGEIHYIVKCDGPEYRAVVRFEATRYQRSIFNGDSVAWQREVIAAIGTVRRTDGMPIRQEIVDAFNAWRFADHALQMAEINASPSKYGYLSDEDRKPPAVVRGAWYDAEFGWVTDAHRTQIAA